MTRITALLDSAEGAIDGTQGDIFLIGRAQRPAAELVACELYKPIEVPLPGMLDRLAIAALQLGEPMRHGVFCRHCATH